MATMITSDCINCGACEPECPNNAISQGEEIYVIDPLLCTECVGFHDYEACAAVCPVDCCVTDPNNVEAEEILIARARALHQDVNIADAFESRFRKGAGKPAPAAATAKKAEPPRAPAPVATPAAPAQPVPAASPADGLDGAEGPLSFLELPEMDAWEIQVCCFKCGERYAEPARHFSIGNVLWCPHCHKSMVVKDNLNFRIRTALKEFYDRWQRGEAEFQARRQRELLEFKERREKELKDFEAHQREELAQIKASLLEISESYDAPGKPAKKGALFGWI